MQFFKPEYFLYLWLVPAVFGIYFFSRKIWEKKLRQLIHGKNILPKLIEGYQNSEWLSKTLLIATVVLLMVLALARPQWGDEKRTVHRKGIDLVFMIDTSLSMLAEDIKPNRLEKAKFEIKTFAQKLTGDRIGMVTFAGSGFLQTPLTLDHAAFLLFMEAVQVGFLPDPGTSLTNAIHLALRIFPQKELKYKALVLFTDGEDHEGGIDKAIEEAKQAGVRIYCIGLGSIEGEPIPLKNERRERTGFKKDRYGQMILTKLNQPLLERIAHETGGIYLRATPSEKEVDLIIKHLHHWGEQEFSEKTIVEKEDQFQVFLVFAFFLLIAEMLLRRRNHKIPHSLACFMMFFLFSGFLESSQDLIKKGNENFQNKRYQSALESYRRVQVQNPDLPEVLYNLGTALYKMDGFRESAQDLETAVQKAKDPALKSKALYNFGNVQYRLGDFEKAMDAYKKALEINPNDQDAKYNLEFLQKQKNSRDKKDQEQKNNKQKKDQKEPKQNQQKQDQQEQGQQQQQQNQGTGQQNQQDQKNQQQQKQDRQNDKKDQQNQQEQSPQNAQPQDQQQDQQKQNQQKGKDEKEKEQQQREQREKEEPKPEEQEQQQKEDKLKQSQEQKGHLKQPLQGQMSMENALNILDALRESEKELQDLRRPPVNKNPPPVEKDW